ncbi:NUDIX domain-containing protein [Oryzifoliimicrobium ureilyticus]|uniref:NUDIX domain-containing protein n=1 Tax=Oryzifoliimicrobium ureilyticus TaxID=3113724 RepID=UPI0030764EEE
MSFADSYLGTLRAVVGHRPLLSVAVRVLVEDDQGRFLLVRRTDDGRWGLPAGAMELGESLSDAIHREAFEEANVTLRKVTPFGISSDPIRERHVYPNGDIVQNVALLAHAYLHTGSPASNDGETSDFRFVTEDQIDADSFAGNEFQTFRLWRQFQETKEFVFV